MKLNNKTHSDKKSWETMGISVSSFDHAAMVKETMENPCWVHFGAGNIFRGFIAKLSEQLLIQGKMKTGIVAGETFDYDIIDRIYTPFDNLTMLVGLKPDGTMEKEIICSVAESIKADINDKCSMKRLREIFINKSLQMVSFTITEKGYALKDINGEFTDIAKQDMKAGPDKARHAMSLMTSLLYERFQNEASAIAMVSMDNCSHNGEKLKDAILDMANAWMEKGYVTEDFLTYLKDESKVSFPWSMIDKITPRPAKEVEDMLAEMGLEQMEAIITSKGTYIAPFVNAEIPQYLVIEDNFPNGRPPLEAAGVYMTDRDTVNNTERMKVTTCLNPLHTALAVYGCLLDYHLIAEEMKDAQLKKLVEKIGYEEGMPVVVNPGILNPMEFIHEVIDVRLPNPFIPDMPQRIATDTSQKMAIRFGETIKSYVQSNTLVAKDLVYIPLAIAGWFRYLLGIDDSGNLMEISSDPMLSDLQACLLGIKLGCPESYHENLKLILSNPILFGMDLYKAELGEKIEGMFIELIQEKGAVRQTLKKYLGE